MADNPAEPEQRYTISQLLRIGEEQTEIARRAKEAGESGGANRFYEWSSTLSALRYMQAHGIPDALKDDS